MSSNLISDVISGSSSVDNPRRDHQSDVGNITGMDFDKLQLVHIFRGHVSVMVRARI